MSEAGKAEVSKTLSSDQFVLRHFFGLLPPVTLNLGNSIYFISPSISFHTRALAAAAEGRVHFGLDRMTRMLAVNCGAQIEQFGRGHVPPKLGCSFRVPRRARAAHDWCRKMHLAVAVGRGPFNSAKDEQCHIFSPFLVLTGCLYLVVRFTDFGYRIIWDWKFGRIGRAAGHVDPKIQIKVECPNPGIRGCDAASTANETSFERSLEIYLPNICDETDAWQTLSVSVKPLKNL